MASLDDDEANSQASSDNDNDENMDDMDETADMDADAENEDNDENEDEEDEDQDDGGDALDDTPSRPPGRTAPKSTVESPTRPAFRRPDRPVDQASDDRVRPKDEDDDAPRTPRTPKMTLEFPVLSVRPEALSASTYDIVPTIASPHSTSINAVTATADLRWVFTGGADGWIRKFHWPDTANGKTLLTVAQRHPFVDSVTKAGVLLSYWENEETAGDKTDNAQSGDDNVALSAVYSLAVHRQGLWLLSGTEGGAINLQAVRHGEGNRITSLQGHASAVSVLSLSVDQRSLLSGSWDKTILDWDLNTGQVKRFFAAGASQISVLEMRPLSSSPIPNDTLQPLQIVHPVAPVAAQETKPPLPTAHTARKGSLMGEDAIGSPTDSLFGGMDMDNDSLFGDTDANGNANLGFEVRDDDDELSRAIANGIQQQETFDGEGDTQMQEALPEQQAEADPVASTDDVPEPSQNPDKQEDEAEASVLDADQIFDDQTEENGTANIPEPDVDEEPATSETIFLDAAIDGTIRVWDRRQPNPVARINPARHTAPWCMSACWSPDGNQIYVGRRNCIVDEYSVHKGLREPTRSLKLPGGSGPVSSVRTMPNGRHLLCASHDIIRLYDLRDEESAKHSKVPFLIVPGHRTGMISHLFIDPTCSFLISVGGNRGWEGAPSETLLGYEIGFPK